MAEESQFDTTDGIIQAVYRLAHRIVGILATIVVLTLLVFAVLVGVYVYLLLSGEAYRQSAADSLPRIEALIFNLWDKLMPIGQTVLHVVAPIVLILLVVALVLALSKSKAAPFELQKIVSDLPSFLAVLIVVTICILPVSGLAVPDVLNNVALVVVGFYFGKRTAGTPEPPAA